MSALSPSINDIQVVATGAFWSGKTAFIEAVSVSDIIYTEFATEQPDFLVPYDFGKLPISPEIALHFIATCGGRYFDVIWRVLLEGLFGIVLVVDSSHPATFRQAKAILETCSGYHLEPLVIAANFQDHPNAWSPDDLRVVLKIPDEIPIIPCVATDPKSVAQVLIALCELVLGDIS